MVPTPIGNMSDITSRVKDTLSSVDLIACEDTRVSGRLLKAIDIKKPMISYHDFNERRQSLRLLETLLDGQSVAVISDAGSPGISDPAYRVVKIAIDNNIEVVALPGPNSIIPALTASGLPTDRFFFEGFLQHRSAARQNRLQQLKNLNHTLVFFESPHRIAKMLADLLNIFGNRRICLSREISKMFEEHLRGTVSEIIELITERPRKGEMVVVVAGVAALKKSRRSTKDDAQSE